MHTAKVAAGSVNLSKSASLSTAVANHTPFFACVLNLSSILQVALVAVEYLPLSEVNQPYLSLNIGVLLSMGDTWPIAGSSMQLIREIQAGYDTYYTGKLMNAHSVDNYDSLHVSGFNGSDFVLDPYTYDYMNATYQRNHDPPVSYLGRHTTEVLREKAMGFLEDALDGERPFFLAVAPIVPHSNMNGTYGGGAGPMWMDEPIPEDRHKHLFPDAKKPTGVSWIHDLPYRNQTVVDYNDHYYRQRLRALQGVDELVDQLITRLEQSDKLENTYIIYTSNNGFHTCSFDEDIRVPFFIRSPGIPEGAQQDIVTTHIDVAPTLFRLAGLPLRDDFDGTAMRIADATGTLHEHVAVEYWGQAMLEGIPTVPNNTYKAVRILSNEYSLYYSVWCNNEHELYDPTTDPYQINNLHPSARKGQADKHRIMGFDITQVISRLDALLLVLKSSMGRVLHPDGSVHNLLDALDHKYDAFYRDQFKVSFDRCEYGYVIDAEGPQTALAYRNGYALEAWV
ncbi:sulfatase family protein [Aspergillus novofumigatus IBT 16806]|uniref:Alkaline phosphatase-like protein n=1 Tax=Aspergillus novofumigatus (strain IBT 16806) TaxID=1392255 RepID=A0A2I1BSD7_ASPN1|nr:alkaline phosphatase-like protein [Aspergillus novofumigatus IBT 16806]PKX88330.1 alkaline phosphatase-like protein [Aspergillus novofumigatus IBT 16806]